MLKKWLACTLALAVLVGSLALSPTLLQVAAEEDDNVLFSEDFNDAAQVGGYDHREFIYDDTGDPAHQGAGKISTLGGEAVAQGGQWPAYLYLKNADGSTPLVLKHGVGYQISFDAKRGEVFKSNSGNRAIIKMAFGNNLSNAADGLTSANAYTLTTLYSALDTSFVHYTFTFSVPDTVSDTLLSRGTYLAVQGPWMNAAVDLWIDNVELRDLSESTDLITFDTEAQQKFYFVDGYSAQTVTEEPVIDEAEGHARVLQIKHINRNGTGTNNADAWPARVALYQAGGVPMVAEKGAEYQIEFDLKAVKIYDTVVPIRVFIAFDDGAKAYTNYDHNARDTNGIELTNFSEASGEWMHVSTTFTAPVNKTMFIIAHHNDTWLSNWNDWDVRLDNIRIVKRHSYNVTLHPNNGGDDMHQLVAEDKDPMEIVPPLPGATFLGWYADEALTQRIDAFIKDGAEYWAKWNTATADGDTVANDQLILLSCFEKRDGIGVDGSAGFIMTKNVAHWTWFPNFFINNSDGSYFYQVKGHKYKVSFDFKPSDPDASFHAQASIYLANKADNNNSNLTAYAEASPSSFAVEENGFRHAVLEMEATSTGYLYIVLARFSTVTIVDNIQIIDVTAQVTADFDGEKTTGYAGDPLTMPALTNEAAHATSVGLPEGHPAHLYKNESLTAATSQLAVVGSYAKDNDLVFRLRYRDLLYRADTFGVSVLGVKTADGETGVQEIGALAAATDTLGDKPLTVDNAEAKQTISVVGYDNQGGLDAELTLAAPDAATDYTVVAYVTTTEGETIYSVVRLGVATSRAAVGTTAPDPLSTVKEAYAPLDEVFGGWDADGDGSLTEADPGALRKGILENSLTGKQGKITNDDTVDILDFVRGHYLNENAAALSVTADSAAARAYRLGNVLIIGDSYSTYSGWLPEGYKTYYNGSKLDLTDVSQTWWRQLIDATNASLCRNDSWSGTTICDTAYNGGNASATGSASSFITRFDALVEQDYFKRHPVDTVLILGGTNDTWANSPVGEAKYEGWTAQDKKQVLPAFAYLLDRIQTELPDARVLNIVNVLLSGEIKSGMQTICAHYGVENLMLSNFNTQDNHPTVSGMTTIKDQILSYLTAH